jgi:hypothetical protein
MTKGNLVNWDTAQLDLTNMRVFEAKMDEVCPDMTVRHVIFPELRKFSRHVALCHKFRGKPSLVQSNETMQELIEVFKNYSHCGNNEIIILLVILTNMFETYFSKEWTVLGWLVGSDKRRGIYGTRN